MSILTFGNALDLVDLLPDESVDLVVTDPPYLQVREYLADDDPLKSLELGMEHTPFAFIERLLKLTDAIWPKLKPTGSIAILLGDTRAGSGGAGGDYREGKKKGTKRKFDGSAKAKRLSGDPSSWPRDKSEAMIPEAFRLGLAYGYNPLAVSVDWGSAVAGFTVPVKARHRWIVRNTVTVCKINPPPGRQGDKFHPATADLIIAAKSPQRYWVDDMPNPSIVEPVQALIAGEPEVEVGNRGYPKDWWVYDNRGTPGHPASWPREIVLPLVKAMSPPTGLVLDPFAGSGVTLEVAQSLGRRGVGFELNREYAAMATEHVGMFLEVCTPEELVLRLS